MNLAPDLGPAHPLFLPGVAGRLFGLYHPPLSAGTARPGVLIIPPFAEEMNKSRRMMALQARALAAAGYSVLLLDLYGTGDSEGDFADARWEIWKEDLEVGRRYLRTQGAASVGLLGVRLGALLAADYARDRGDIARLVGWQPVAVGEAMITQFLRLRLAAELLAGGAGTGSTGALREQLRRGETLEVAGYTLAPALVQAIDALRLESLLSAGGPSLHWLEIVADAAQSVPPGARRVCDALFRRGIAVSARAIAGTPFWSSAEIVVVPGLLPATVEAFDEDAA